MIRYLLKQLVNITVFLVITGAITLSCAFILDAITDSITWNHLDKISGWNWISLFLALLSVMAFIHITKEHFRMFVAQNEKDRKEQP